MKYILILAIAVVIWTKPAGAQKKKALTPESFKEWTGIGLFDISNNGTYAYYSSGVAPYTNQTFHIRATDKSWEIDIENLSNAKFSNDSRLMYGNLPNDTLVVIDLIKHNIKKHPNVAKYGLFMSNKTEWLAIGYKDKSFAFENLVTGQRKKVENVASYTVGPIGSAILLDTEESNRHVLTWYDLRTGKLKPFYRGIKISNMIFDNAEKTMAFLTGSKENLSLWFYDLNEDSAKLLLDGPSLGGDSLKLTPGKFYGFGKDNQHIFFSMEENRKMQKEANGALTIWNYNDPYLQSDVALKTAPTWLYNVDVKSGEIKRLTFKNQQITSFIRNTGKYFLVESFNGRLDEVNWNGSAKRNYLLCNAYTGKVISIKSDVKRIWPIFFISPSGKFVIYFDPESKRYYSYSIASGKTNELLQDVNQSVFQVDANFDQTETLAGIYGWLPNDSGIIIGSTYDILLADPNGQSKTKNLTKGYGEKSHIIFNPIDLEKDRIFSDKEFTLSAFNIENKNLGFYKLKFGESINEGKINMLSRYVSELQSPYLKRTDAIKKSRDEDKYVVVWESVNEAPNFYFTNNLSRFQKLSDNKPQAGYKWMTAELHNYTDSQGRKYQGILYKPDDFDSSRKYPVVFDYYEMRSNELNRYQNPDFFGGDINIPLLTSNDYLCFRINVPVTQGNIGDDVLRAANAAADHLEKFKWVNGNKIAVSGHSFGGWETNYIITHTKRFAAAISAAGISDLTVLSHTVWPRQGCSMMSYISNGPFKMGKEFSEDKNLYLKYSPIFNSLNVSTPVLLMHNPGDINALFEQSRSFFMELRTLGKPVWLLSYDKESHLIGNEENVVDFYQRSQEFLDHYLKDRPAPSWMKEPNIN